MTRACKTLHQIEFTNADGVRETIPAGREVEAGRIPADELDALVDLKAVRLFDPLDGDLNGKPGGSKPGRRRKAAPATPVETDELDTQPSDPTDSGLFD